MHIPVLQKETLEYLDPRPNENFIDATAGMGGHSRLILEKTKPEGKVLGIDADVKSCEKLKNIDRLIPVNGNFKNLKKIIEERDFKNISGVLFDIGFSSWQIEKSGRGFSFQTDEPLDMRLGESALTAEEIVNNWSEKELEKILKEYGEERFAKKIAKKIIWARQKRPIKTTFQLVKIIQGGMPIRRYNKIHFATKTFQALRIAVNDELNNLKEALPQALEIINPGGRIAVISFHSLEDRIVKNFFKEKKELKILTKKPVTASEEEIKANPRSRSAKLRAAIKI